LEGNELFFWPFLPKLTLPILILVSYMSVRQSDNYLLHNLHMSCCYLVFIALC
jgi:hypothetical protein